MQAPSSSLPSYWAICQQLQQGRFVDLTHGFDTNSSHFETATPMQVKDVCAQEQDGFWVQQFQLEGQWGTHVDAPAHGFKGGRTVDQITLQEMVLPLVVIDIHTQVAQNPDYIVMVDDVLAWEDRYGRIPQGAFVALRTDWSHRWPHQEAMYNYDAERVSRTPGWGLDALSYLYDDCQITASGHETFDPDPGFRAKSTNWACERYILGRNHYQIELLTNLDQCPPKGALVICAFPKPLQASGFPARVFAICPP
jgi:kynurenine formamidase